jgi:hypothetical protein
MRHPQSRATLNGMNAFDVLTVVFVIVGIPLLVTLAVIPAVWDVLDARAKSTRKVNSRQPAVTGPILTRW